MVDSAKVDSAPTDSATGDSSTDAALACTGPVEVDASAVDGTTFTCCVGLVDSVIGDAGFVMLDAGVVTGDPAVDNCCKAIIAHVDAVPSDYTSSGNTLPTCCNALGLPTGVACTPWGPPMPPEMSPRTIEVA